MNVGIIPARFGSTRFPGKPLAMISGKPMIQWVYEAASSAKCFDIVFIATDDFRIESFAKSINANVILTPDTLQSGTDRVYCAVKLLQKQNKISEIDVVVNIQGDEPLCPPQLFEDLINSFFVNSAQICTPITRIDSEAEYLDKNVVKVVVNSEKMALYFSRSPIPFIKQFSTSIPLFRHIGLYAYNEEVLEFFANSKQSSLEINESLEQLRLLEEGFTIHCLETTFKSHSVDVPTDIETIEQMISQ